MRPALPSPLWGFLLGALLSCAKAPPPVKPGPPIPAQPVTDLGGMVEECDGMVAALATFKQCPNLEVDDRADLDDWIERAGKDFAAGRKATPDDPNAQRAIALACRRATRSVQAANERCLAGPRPKDAWWGVRRR